MESDHLRQSIMCQVDRLMSQLKDLEDGREDMEETEYVECRQETLDQLKEFQQKLARFDQGTMTLADPLQATQLAIQAAVSAAFQTADIIQLFARRQPDQLRIRLQQLSRDLKLGRISPQAFSSQRAEVLCALKRLGETLSTEELLFIEEQSTDRQRNFANSC